MPKQKYSLEPGGPQRLTLEWAGAFNKLSVLFDEQEVGFVEKAKDLRRGQTFTLPDGSTLQVTLKSGMTTTLVAERNGVPLPGSAGHPESQLNTAVGLLFFVAFINVVLGVVSLVVDLSGLVNGPFAIAFGLVFAALGYFTRKRSAIALGLATAIFILDSLLVVVSAMTSGGRAPVGGLVFRVFILVSLFSGFPAIRKLKETDKAATPIGPIPR